MRNIAEINERILQHNAVVWSVTEFKAKVAEIGLTAAAKQVDVVTTGSFEPMESSGAILNLGHTDPPIKIRNCWLNGVPAYAGFGAVDLYLGATQLSDDNESEERGGGHVIEDLIAGKSVNLRAIGQGTDCYPRTNFTTTITKDTINQFYLYNPRNLYQNFIVGVNGGDRTLYTYLGPLQPDWVMPYFLMQAQFRRCLTIPSYCRSALAVGFFWGVALVILLGRVPSIFRCKSG